MNNRIVKVSSIFVLLTAIMILINDVYSLIYCFSDAFDIFDEEFVAILHQDVIKRCILEMTFSLAVIILAIITFSIVGKEKRIKVLKGCLVAILILLALSVLYNLLIYIPYIFEDWSILYDEIIQMIRVWSYLGLAICIVALFSFILTLASLIATIDYATKKEKEMLMQVTNSIISAPNDNFQSFQNASGAQLDLQNSNVNSFDANISGSQNNDLAVLLGLTSKETKLRNNNIESVNTQNVIFNSNATKIDNSGMSDDANLNSQKEEIEQRRENLRKQIGAEKLKYAKMKAKEYKAKLDSGEFTQAEFEVLMTALKKELLYK